MLPKNPESPIDREKNKHVGSDKVGEKKTLRANILSRKLNYFGHIVRHPCLEKSIMQGMVDGKRKRGRPTASWLDDIKKYTGTSISNTTRIIEHRTRWRTLTRATPVYVYAM